MPGSSPGMTMARGLLSDAAEAGGLLPSPLRAGLSHMEIPESLPQLGAASRERNWSVHRNRKENKTESECEWRRRPFDPYPDPISFSSPIFPYAIPLPCGEGKNNPPFANVYAAADYGCRLIRPTRLLKTPSAIPPDAKWHWRCGDSECLRAPGNSAW